MYKPIKVTCSMRKNAQTPCSKRKFINNATVRKGFTLIELLVVVAIIAILAAIAIPNFLEAHIRSKVSRVKTELRTLAAAIESYTIENNKPPYDGEPGSEHYGWVNSQKQLTTPVAFITSIPVDQFQDASLKTLTLQPGHTYFVDHPADTRHSYDYGTFYWQIKNGDPVMTDKWYRSFGNSLWTIGSCGPDKTFRPATAFAFGFGNHYDPTNGTISEGDIYRTQAYSP